MGSIPVDGTPHAVCIPYPAQGHINAIFRLAKVLHGRGFYITFVSTEYNHKRLLKSRGSSFQDDLPPRFRFETIPDGLPPSDDIDTTQDLVALCASIPKTCLAPFTSLISRLNNEPDVPPVTCIVSDGATTFTLEAAKQFGIPDVLFWSTGAASVLGFTQFKHLIQRGYIPLKDMSDMTNGYLETKIDWIPGMKDIRLRDLPSFIRTTDPNDIFLNFIVNEIENAPKASALILNTFDALDKDVLDTLSAMYPRVYTIGSLQLMLNHIEDERLKSAGTNLWKEEPGCIDWLNDKEPNSVVYVNFGSITVMTVQQLTEFAWGLAHSKKPFLWIIRPDLVAGETAMLPPEFVTETKERGMLASWCSQEDVLNHPAIGGFLTHNGWNSTMESICSGVPMICWPFFADQQTNCRYCCVEWGIGLEIDNDVKRNEVEKLLRELMEGEKGKEMKKNVMNWKKKAEEATAPGGSSTINFEKLLNEVLLPN